MTQYRTAPSVRYNSRPAAASNDIGMMYNTATQVAAMEANQAAGDRMLDDAEQMRTQESNQRILQIQHQQALLRDTSRVREAKERATLLQARSQVFRQATQLRSLERAQEAQEADYALADSFADLGAYAGTQNWGSFYSQRKAILGDPRYKKSKEVRERMETINQMLPQWGESYNSQGDARSFVEVSREASSPDWATKKEALRILALKSENPSGFLSSVPELSPVQRMELMSFMEKNPLVEDQSKIQQVNQFKQNFQEQAMVMSDGNPEKYLQLMSSPETIKKMQSATRGFLYNQTEDDMDDVTARDKTIGTIGLEQLQFYINDKIDNSAGFLSITRGISELSDMFRDPRIKAMAPETLMKVVPAEYWDTFDLSTGELKNTLLQGGVKLGWGVKKLSQVSPQARAKIAGIIAKAAPNILKKQAGKSLAAVASNAVRAGAVGTAKLGVKALGTLVTLGIDAGMFYKDAGKDMGAIREAFEKIKQTQGTLRAMASMGTTSPDLQQYMVGLSQAINDVNILTERHGINVKLDLNNVLSNQVLKKLQASLLVDRVGGMGYGSSQIMQNTQTSQTKPTWDSLQK